jgi:ATP-dependent DNA helicase RecG
MRPPSLFPLFSEISTLRGVGPKLAPLLTRAAGPVVRDLAFLSPSGLILRSEATVRTAGDGELVILEIVVDQHLPPQRRGQPWRIRAHDDSGFVTLVWFKGFGEHLQRAHPPGAERVVSGKLERFGIEAQMAHPDHLLPRERRDQIALVEPVYPGVTGLAPRVLSRLAREALDRAPALDEWQDPAWLQRRSWPGWREALEQLHTPRNADDLAPDAPHRQRLAFDELLAHHLAMAQRKAHRRAEPTPPIPASDLARAVEARLPFRLTGAQSRTLGEIRADLASGERMSRLVQGDVGSGKTVVAMLAIAELAGAGRQTALMAPTEILARQHLESLREPLEHVGIKTVLLTGRDKGAQRQEKLAALADGSAALAVGTHALFQDDVRFSSLGLAVIDEQHRFGVAERRRLMAKGEAVHLMALSATPIPRTLELTLFGDLDVSRIDEKPPGRQPVVTTATPLTRVDSVIQRLAEATRGGAQAFWICPLVAESELLDVKAAEVRAADLTARLDAPVGLIHGKMPAAEKDRVMGEFAAGRIAVLVATTVVEVGVNVPNATIMVIEHAERFGLAQLHQLRGRVGRGSGHSACLLLYAAPLSAAGKARIEILRETEDGFEIAERDLTLRGGGDLLGLKQSGLPNYRFADPVAQAELVRAAADDARLVLARDPQLTSERGQRLRVLCELFDWRADDAFAEAS